MNNWGRPDVLYSVNLPLVEKLFHDDGLKVYWTSVWKNGYQGLFKEVPSPVDNRGEAARETTGANVPHEGGGNSQCIAEEGRLVFTFQQNAARPLDPASAPEGSDGWTLAQGAVSVTPLLPSFEELPENEHGFSCLQDREWKLKL